MGNRKNSGLERWRGLAGACALGAGLAWSAPALAGAVPTPPWGSGEVVYVVGGEGTNVYSLRDYLAAQASGIEITGAPRATAPPAIPPATAIEPEPAVVVQPVVPVSPPIRSQAPAAPAAASVQSAASETKSSSRKRGFYVAWRAIPGLSNVDDITRSPSAPINLEDDKIEATIASSAALGFDWRRYNVPLRTELEYRYRYHFDIETRSRSTNTFYDTSTRVMHTVQANIAYELALLDDLDWLVGGGIGWNRSSTTTNRVDTATNVGVSEDAINNALTWHLDVGLNWRFAEQWSVEAMYRYVDLGELDIGPFATGDSVHFDESFAHELVVGINYHF
ncbi:MAG: porin family protein [Proteobacteria bacterium]|nr:porin family protein [Pseudomonadota bacterium]